MNKYENAVFSQTKHKKELTKSQRNTAAIKSNHVQVQRSCFFKFWQKICKKKTVQVPQENNRSNLNSN